MVRFGDDGPPSDAERFIFSFGLASGSPAQTHFTSGPSEPLDGDAYRWRTATFPAPAQALTAEGAAFYLLLPGSDQPFARGTTAFLDETGSVQHGITDVPLFRWGHGQEETTQHWAMLEVEVGLEHDEESEQHPEPDTTASEAPVERGNDWEMTPEDRADSDDSFIDVKLPLPHHDNFAKGEGFDVYIDAARGLPDNVAVSKVSVKVLDDKKNVIGAETTEFCKPNSMATSPTFRALAEFRSENFDPTITLLFRVDAYDRFHHELKCVGYALLNPFCDPEKRDEQPQFKNQQHFQLNEGGHQIPLHKRPPSLVGLSHKSLLSKPKVSCATLLVRIHKGPKSEDGLTTLKREEIDPAEYARYGTMIAAGPYSSKCYDSTRSRPSAIEKRLYERRGQTRAKTLIRQYAQNELCSEALGARKADTFSQDEVNDWIKARVEGKPAGKAEDAMLDYTYMNPYQEDLGFKVVVDGLNNMPYPSGFSAKPTFYKVVFTLSPPGFYFNEGETRLANEAFFTLSYDLGSHRSSPRFTDIIHPFEHVEYRPEMLVVFEVRKVQYVMAQGNPRFLVDPPEKGYWSAMRVFKKDEKGVPLKYVDSGCTVLPLFAGRVPKDLLTAEDPWRWILDDVVRNRSFRQCSVVEKGAGISVRLVDAQVDAFHQPESKPINYQYLNYLLDIEELGLAFPPYMEYEKGDNAKKQVLAVVPASYRKTQEETNEFAKLVNRKFSEETGIDHYNLD